MILTKEIAFRFNLLAWTLNLEWSGKEGFNKAGEHEWTCGGTTNRRGIARAYGGLTFVSVQDAGHMVCVMLFLHAKG